ncbi:hypothetical protein ATANTOWER_020818 [Ataeniobius toweri]|uniref:Uncharacterized protein n=1 Tax=Ataeniobius toweri TaxID=208326 RepID=A0ABU7BRC9_9TELE|nr:hypothetical protein [Ataeniobius toweri]
MSSDRAFRRVAKFGRRLGSPSPISIKSDAFADLHTAGSILPSHSSFEICAPRFPDMNLLDCPECREISVSLMEH